MGKRKIKWTDEEAPIVDKGHGTEALGPSDSSDSGSDIRGGPGIGREEILDLDKGNTSDVDNGSPNASAGPDIGDADLDSDSDRSGTGERTTAGRDTPVPEAADIMPDRIVNRHEAGTDGVPEDGDNPGVDEES
jgi:hypothetical protein